MGEKPEGVGLDTPMLGSDGQFHWTDPDGTPMAGPMHPRDAADMEYQKTTAAKNNAEDALNEANQQHGPDSPEAKEAGDNFLKAYEADRHAEAVSNEIRERYPQGTEADQAMNQMNRT